MQKTSFLRLPRVGKDLLNLRCLLLDRLAAYEVNLERTFLAGIPIYFGSERYTCRINSRQVYLLNFFCLGDLNLFVFWMPENCIFEVPQKHNFQVAIIAEITSSLFQVSGCILVRRAPQVVRFLRKENICFHEMTRNELSHVVCERSFCANCPHTTEQGTCKKFFGQFLVDKWSFDHR